MARLVVVFLLASLALPVCLAEPDDVAPPQVTSFVFAKSSYGPGEVITATLHVTDQTAINSVWFTMRNRDGGLVLHGAPTDGCAIPDGAKDVDITCRLTLPDEAPSGFYEIHQLGTHDTIGHSSNLYGAQLGAFAGLGVHVESPFGDRTGPTLSEIQVSPATVQAGSPVTVTFRATDQSSVREGMVSFHHIGRSPSLGASCTVDGATDATLTCVVPTDVRHARGQYVLQAASARDQLGYVGSLHAWGLTTGELAKTTFTMESDNSDAQTPKLTGIDLPDGSVPRGGPFTVKVHAEDASGLAATVLRVQTVHGTALLQADDCTFTGPPAPVASCTGQIPANYPQGEVRMELLYLEDRVLNRWHYMLGVEGSPYADSYKADARHDVRFFVGPAPLRDPGPLAGLVDAVDPLFSVAEPGTVLPIVVETAEALESVTARFVSEAGRALGVIDCALDANQTVIGSLCHLIVPEDADVGLYVLDELSVVLEDGTRKTWQAGDAQGTDDGPSFAVAADSEAPLAIAQEAWTNQTQGGMTLATFNAVGERRYNMPMLVPLLGYMPPTGGTSDGSAGFVPPAATTPSWPAAEAGRGGLEEARPAPSTAVAVTLAALALALRRRAKQ